MNLNKNRSGHRRTECKQENSNLIQEKFIEDRSISARKMVWTLVKVYLTESLSAI